MFHLHIKAFFFKLAELKQALTGFFFQTIVTSNDRDLESGVIIGNFR